MLRFCTVTATTRLSPCRKAYTSAISVAGSRSTAGESLWSAAQATAADTNSPRPSARSSRELFFIVIPPPTVRNCAQYVYAAGGRSDGFGRPVPQGSPGERRAGRRRGLPSESEGRPGAACRPRGGSMFGVGCGSREERSLPLRSRLLGGHLLALAFLLGAQLGGELGAELFRL